MPRYTVIFRNDAESATREFEAETPEQALVFAKVAYEDCPDSFWFDRYDGRPPNEIAVYDRKGGERAIWYDADKRLRLTVTDLVKAAEKVIERWQEGDVAEAVRDLSEALVRTKGERHQAWLLRAFDIGSARR
jgi:hypothetical protein